MPRGLVRFHHAGTFHFITFSCYHRLPLLVRPGAYRVFETQLEATRIRYEFVVAGYVLMPEHVHLLVNEPHRGTLATVIQVLKQMTSRKLKKPGEPQFWQRRYYDYVVPTEKKRIKGLQLHVTGILLSADYPRISRTGLGRVFAIMQRERSVSSKSNPSGPPAAASSEHNSRSPPKRSRSENPRCPQIFVAPSFAQSHRVKGGKATRHPSDRALKTRVVHKFSLPHPSRNLTA